MILEKDPIRRLERQSLLFRRAVYVLSGVLLVVCLVLLFTKSLWWALLPALGALFLVLFYTGRTYLAEQQILLNYCDPESYGRLYDQKRAEGKDVSENVEEQVDFYTGRFDRVIETQRAFLAQEMPPRTTNEDRKRSLYFLVLALYFTGRGEEAGEEMELHSADLPDSGIYRSLLAFVDDMLEENFPHAVELSSGAIRRQRYDLYRVVCAYCAALGYEAMNRPDAARRMYQNIARVDNKSWFGQTASSRLAE